MDMDREIAAAVESELRKCLQAARKHGWAGNDCDYEFGELDIESVEIALEPLCEARGTDLTQEDINNGIWLVRMDSWLTDTR